MYKKEEQIRKVKQIAQEEILRELTAFLSFFLTISGPSKRSIFESGSELDILPPVRPEGNVSMFMIVR